MINKSKPKFNNAGEMLTSLKELGKRNTAPLKKSAAELKRVEKKYQKEADDYHRLYGA